MATLKDIADEAGVSVATVSRVLKDRQKGRWGSAERVRQIAAALNYQPNRLAQGLVEGRSGSIAWVSALSRPNSGHITRQLTLAAQSHNCLLAIHDHGGEVRVTMRALNDLLSRRVDGVVFEDTGRLLKDRQIRQLLKQFPAVVTIPISHQSGVRTFDQVVQDRTVAMHQMARHALQSGRCRPLAVIKPSITNQMKVAALRQTLKEGGCDLPPERVVMVNRGRSSRDLMRIYDQALGNMPPFDWVWCNNDSMAMAMMAWLRDRGRSVGEDVAVVGYNDEPIAMYQSPALASVSRSDRELIRIAAEMLFDRLADANLPPRQRTVSTALVWRPSAGAPEIPTPQSEDDWSGE